MKKYTLRDLLKIKNGRDYKNLDKGDVPVYGSGGIMTYVNRFLFNDESILLPRKGSLSNIMYVNRPFWTVDTMYWTEVNTEIVYPKYLYFYLKLMDLSSRDSGSTLPSMTFDAYYDISVTIPHLDVQKKVLSLLNPIDDKIIVNNKINDNLANMAQDIYMHYFFKKSPNGKLNNILFEADKSKVQVGDAKNSKGQYPFFTSGASILTWNEYFVDGRYCFLNTGGNADVKFNVGKSAYSTDTWCIHTSNDMTDYLYLLLSTIKEELNKKYFQGTGLKHLQKDLLKDKDIYIPTDTELFNFNNLVKPLFNNISKNTIEIDNLVKLRDFLLPLLMNGQATIE